MYMHTNRRKQTQAKIDRVVDGKCIYCGDPVKSLWYGIGAIRPIDPPH